MSRKGRKRKSEKITIGITAAFSTALLMTGCVSNGEHTATNNSQSSNTNQKDSSSHATSMRLVNIDADYLKLCQDIANNTRVQSENCLNSDEASDNSQWYYLPIYKKEGTVSPNIGEVIAESGTSNDPSQDGKTIAVIDDINRGKESFLLPSENYGIEPQHIDADYVEVCVDENNNRIDDSECAVGETPDSNNSSNNHTHSSLMWIPLFLNTGGSRGGTYIPPVGSPVNTDAAIKDKSQLSSNNISKAPSTGGNNLYSKTGEKVQNSQRGAKGNNKGSVSRGGTGGSGKVGGHSGKSGG